jgi:hypothetical protein
MLQSAAPPQAPTPAIASKAEATAVMIEIRDLMVELCEIVEEETALVRAGRLTSAGKMAERKSELARAFMDHAALPREHDAAAS